MSVFVFCVPLYEMRSMLLYAFLEVFSSFFFFSFSSILLVLVLVLLLLLLPTASSASHQGFPTVHHLRLLVPSFPRSLLASAFALLLLFLLLFLFSRFNAVRSSSRQIESNQIRSDRQSISD